MSMPLVLIIASGLPLIALYFLSKAEASRGRKIVLSGARDKLDSIVLNRMKSWERWKVYVGASSFRLFLHYLLHQCLGAALFLINWTEKKVHGLRHRNKLVAKVAVGDDNHLLHIAKHKDEVALSEEEKQELKEKSLNQ